MRKGQVKIIEKAKTRQFPKEIIEYFEKSEESLKNLENLYFCLIYRQNNGLEISIKDIELYISIINNYKDSGGINRFYLYDLMKLEKNDIKKILLHTHHYGSVIAEIYLRNNIMLEDAIKLTYYAQHQKKKIKKRMMYILTYGSYYDKNEKKYQNAYNYPIKEKIRIAKCNDILNFEKTSRKILEKNISLEDHYNNEKWHQYLTTIRNSYFKNEHILYYDEKNIQNRLRKIVEENQIDSNMTLSGKVVKSTCYVGKESMELYLEGLSQCNYSSAGNYYYYPAIYHNQNADTLYFYYKTKEFYIKTKTTKRLVPISLKKLNALQNYYKEPIKYFINAIFDFLINSGEIIIKDIKRIINNSKMMPPVMISECLGKRTLQEVFTTKYKKPIPINWNKGDLFINYLFYKNYEYVREQDRPYFLQLCKNMTKTNAINNFYLHYTSSNSNNALLTYCMNGECIALPNGSVQHDYLVDDYIRISKLLKRKIKIKYNSRKKLKEEHDRLSREYEIKGMKVPKKSKFNKLRKMLPNDFEWIKNKQRIVQEGNNMDHCVATYAEKVNKDKCAIYSLLYKPTNIRYTIEFVTDNQNYKIAQIQGRGNSGCPKEVREYIQSFLAS